MTVRICGIIAASLMPCTTPSRDQHLRVRGQPAGQRGGDEPGDAGQEHRSAPVAVTEPRSGDQLGAADGGRLTMNELARQVFVSRSGISQVVTAMAKHGLVERQGDPDNLRVTFAVLTDRGRELLTTSTSTSARTPRTRPRPVQSGRRSAVEREEARDAALIEPGGNGPSITTTHRSSSRVTASNTGLSLLTTPPSPSGRLLR